MRCKEFVNLMDPFLDGELTQDKKEMFLKHKDQCPECKKVFAARNQLFSMMDAAQDLPWTVNIAEKVMNEIAMEVSPERPVPVRMPLLIAASFGVCVFVAVFLAGTMGIMGHHVVTDAVKMLISIIELPEEIQQSLNELAAFMKGSWIALAAAGGFIGKFIMTALSTILILSIPLLVLVAIVVWGIRITRNKIKGIAVF